MSGRCFACLLPLFRDRYERWLSSVLSLVREADARVTNKNFNDGQIALCQDCDQKLNNAEVISRAIEFMKEKLEADLEAIFQLIMGTEQSWVNEKMFEMRKEFMDAAGFTILYKKRGGGGKTGRMIDPCLFCLSEVPPYQVQDGNTMKSLLKLVGGGGDEGDEYDCGHIHVCQKNTFFLCTSCNSLFSSAIKYWNSIFVQKHSLKHGMKEFREMLVMAENKVNDPIRYSFLVVTGDKKPIKIEAEDAKFKVNACGGVDYENVAMDLRLNVKKEKAEERNQGGSGKPMTMPKKYEYNPN